jgi:hypothetical protein
MTIREMLDEQERQLLGARGPRQEWVPADSPLAHHFVSIPGQRPCFKRWVPVRESPEERCPLCRSKLCNGGCGGGDE